MSGGRPQLLMEHCGHVETDGGLQSWVAGIIVWGGALRATIDNLRSFSHVNLIKRLLKCCCPFNFVLQETSI